MVRSTNNYLDESLKEITWLHYQLTGPTPLFSFKSENQTMHNGNLEIRILTFVEKLRTMKLNVINNVIYS